MYMKRLNWLGLILAIFILGSTSLELQAQMFTLPDIVPASACRVGAVVSTDGFTSTGFSNVRTANPNDQIVAGAWVVANNFVPDTSIIAPPNCNFAGAAGLGLAEDGQGINLMGVRLVPTIGSAAEADIRKVILIWDINANGIWDPLLDLVLQTMPGDALDTQEGAVFYYGPQSPLFVLSNTDETAVANTASSCFIGADDNTPVVGLGPGLGQYPNSDNNNENGCFVALLAVVLIGDNPTTGTQFGLQLEAKSGDIPGTTGISTVTFSSGFSSSRNPQASNVRLHMIGGSPSSHTPIEHISNGSGNPESHVASISFSGGELGEGLLTRFRAHEIMPGTREVIAMAVGICDGGFLANTNVAVLPPIAGAPPTVAGGLGSLPCIPSGGTDGFATGINGATLIFRGPLARYMGTVRMYADECTAAGIAAATCTVGDIAPAGVVPTTASDAGGGDGFFFQAGELSEQVTAKYNEQTGEAYAQFGGRQEQILFTGNGNPVANGADFACVAAAVCVVTGTAGTAPLILLFTVDIDQNAPAGNVDVFLGLQSFDDTALNLASPVLSNPCAVLRGTASTFPAAPNNSAGVANRGSCASNFLNIGPEIYSFSVEGSEHPSTPNNLAAFDTNSSCFLDDPEFFAMIDGWVGSQIGDNLFFDGVDSWVGQTNVCDVVASSISALSIDTVSLEANLATSATTFVVAGQGIEGLNVEVLSLDGTTIFSQSAAGTHLTWNQSTTNGAPVANGTYLYVVTVEGADGQTVASEVGKLAVVR
jgi:hypothetical protein